MNLQPLPQPELAAWIDAEGIEFEYESILHVNEWFKVHSTNKAINFVESGRAIRLAPGALNDYYLPKGTEPHNPDDLTPEQITEGGLYRAVTLEECDGRHGMDGSNCQEVWNSGRWLPAMLGKNLDCSYRVPITTPLPAVKESLTPQPATGRSKTPMTDAVKCHQGRGIWTVNASYMEQLETELTAALAERDEARETLDLMCDEFQRIKALAGLPLEAHTFCERAISGIKQRVPLVEQRDKAGKERDEARRLLGEARRVMQGIYDDTECYADGAPDASAHDRLCNEISGKLRQPLNQITNHLK